MDTHSIAVLKRKIDARYGDRIGSATIDELLAGSAPEFHRSRQLVHAGVSDWLTLRSYSTFCRFDERHEVYEALLQRVDPALRFPRSKAARFVGDGFGEGSLNSYRVVECSGHKVFEKIYLKESADYENVMWFYANVQPALSDAGLASPALKSVVEGNLLSIVYSEYVEDTQPVSRAQAIRFYKEQSGNLGAVEPPTSDAPSRSFKHHALYLDGRSKAAELLSRDGIDGSEALSSIEEAVEGTVESFGHGDWYCKNINRDGVVFDWDRCGFYPAGFDLAYCFSKSLPVDSLADLARAISDFTSASAKPEVRPAIWFFCLIFYSRRVGVQVSEPFLRELYREVKAIFGVN